MIDTRGVIYKGRKEGMNEYKERHAVDTDARSLEDAIKVQLAIVFHFE